MATYLLGIELEYEKELSEEQIEMIKNWLRTFYRSENPELLSLESAITEWPESLHDRYLVKWKRMQGSLVKIAQPEANSSTTEYVERVV